MRIAKAEKKPEVAAALQPDLDLAMMHMRDAQHDMEAIPEAMRSTPSY
jgi:hypothetical protein